MWLSVVQYQAVMEAIDQYKTNIDPTADQMGAEHSNRDLLHAIYEVEDKIIGANIPT